MGLLQLKYLTAALFCRTQVHRTTGPGQNGVLSENKQVVFCHIINMSFCIAAR